MTRDDKDSALRAAAQQMEGVFLNMMLQSMRDANAVFAEGNMMSSRDEQFYQGMYDKQLSLNISQRGGIGLADVIVKQMQSQAESRNRTPDVSGDISSYLKHPINARVTGSDIADGGTEAIRTSTTVAVESSDTGQADHWESPSEFVQAIYPHAQRAAAQLGVSPEAVVAQAVLETGWGQHVMED